MSSTKLIRKFNLVIDRFLHLENELVKLVTKVGSVEWMLSLKVVSLSLTKDSV